MLLRKLVCVYLCDNAISSAPFCTLHFSPQMPTSDLSWPVYLPSTRSQIGDFWKLIQKQQQQNYHRHDYQQQKKKKQQ
jgi:hypothetical protein